MQSTQANDRSKKVLQVLGVIVVGVISSAVWDLVKPILLGALKYAIAISTLGVTRLQDSIYIKASGNNDALVVLIAMLTVVSVVLLTGYVVILALRSHRTFDAKIGLIALAIINIAILFQLSNLIYSKQWMTYRLRLERLAATYSTEQQIRARAVQVDNIDGKASFFKYLEVLEQDVRLHGLPLPKNDPRSSP